MGGTVIVDVMFFCSSWMISAFSCVAVWLAWIYVEPEYNEDGILTRVSDRSVRARALLTAGSIAIWICTLFGSGLSSSNDFFWFWHRYPVLLVILFLLADSLLIASVVYAWQGRGSGKWILWITTPIVAIVSLVVTLLFSLSSFSKSGR
jgi:hypothetical protein